ncbi:MAG: metallophosphoesterase [Limisphaerales bacterium]
MTAAIGFSEAFSDAIIRGPYLQTGTSSNIVVRWRTAETNWGVVYYGLKKSNLDLKATTAGQHTEHIILVSDLQPETKYFYAIGTTNSIFASAGTNEFFTSPPGGSTKSTRVWVIGDSGTAKPEQFSVRDAYYKFTEDRRTDLWFMLGDNAYTHGLDKEYQKAMFEVYSNLFVKSVCWPTLGNHDGRSANSQTQSGVYYDIFSLPTQGQAGGEMSGTEAYYSYNYANIHFVCLNTHDMDRSTNGVMLSWLKKDLAANHLDWTIAYFHHPPYTKGSHDSDAKSGENIDLTEVRENILPIMEAGGVDLVLCGHSHDYERSFLLDGHYGYSETLTDANKKNKGNGREEEDGAYRKPTLGSAPHEGMVYVVAGSSGKITGGSLDHPAMYLSTNSLGSVVLDIKGPRLDLTFINEKGKKLDHFTILKGKE